MDYDKDIEQLEAKLNITEHFQVPEGYFENFTDSMMAKLPEQPFQPMKSNTLKRRTQYKRIAAAVATFFVLGVSTYTLYYNSSSSATHNETAETSVPTVINNGNSDEAYTIDEAAEYAMIDQQTLHELITE